MGGEGLGEPLGDGSGEGLGGSYGLGDGSGDELGIGLGLGSGDEPGAGTVIGPHRRSALMVNRQVQISLRELQLWKRQAKAIGRAPRHLNSINGILQAAEKGRREFAEISERDFRVRCRDQDEFNRQAFQLME